MGEVIQFPTTAKPTAKRGRRYSSTALAARGVASAYAILTAKRERIATVQFHQPAEGHYACSVVGRWRGVQRWELGSGGDETAAAHNMTIGAVKIHAADGETWAEQLRSAGYQIVRKLQVVGSPSA